MKRIISLGCLLLMVATMNAQQILRIKIKDAEKKEALQGATIKVDGLMAGVADSTGRADMTVSNGQHNIEISTLGYITQNIIIQQVDTNILTILMTEDNTNLEEVTLIASTRNNQAIESSPLKVEVLGKEEVGEEVGIRPGNIASILGDVSGVQIQQSSAVSGNSNVKIQGLPGRYTQILRDGMPLYDGFSGGFGILTIPPLDLKQIELIKGSASTLFGGGAIAGLINLISRKPTFEQEADIVANYTTLSELNLNAFVAKRYKKMGYTLFAGYTTQQAKDVNNDGFSDVPTSNCLLLHPKLFFYLSDKTIVSVGYSGTFDKRKGGDMLVLQHKEDNLHQYFEENNSTRHTGEYAIDHFFKGDTKLTIKGSASYFDKTTKDNLLELAAGQLSYYNEVSLYKPIGHSQLVAGINTVGDNYQVKHNDLVPLQSFANTTIGAFAQYTLHIKDKTTIDAGLRIDDHLKYGLFVLPRIAFFHQIDKHFGARGGFGMGYKTPNPLMQQDIEYAPNYILPLADSVKAERSLGGNFDVNYKKEWDKEHTLFINGSAFLTQIDHPLYIGQGYALENRKDPLVTAGTDIYVKMGIKKWELYGGYTFTSVPATYGPAGNIPLSPKNRLAFVVVKEIEEEWRFGLEGSYTGSQNRYDGSQTPGYMFVALMAQYKLGKHVLLVLNCENLLDYRMSKEEALYTGSISYPTFKPLWAPIDGRVVNLSVRWKL